MASFRRTTIFCCQPEFSPIKIWLNFELKISFPPFLEAPRPTIHTHVRLIPPQCGRGFPNLAEELGINLENYDITREEYEALVAAAAEKFGFCEQYRLYPLIGGAYNCYACITHPRILLQAGQTYKIGQTCFDEKGRYASGLPEPNLFYLTEFKGSIFEVLVAEHVKLLLFRFSNERKAIITINNLLDTELQLPPANKILR